MCGIVTWAGRRPAQSLEGALRAIRHRGPDAQGRWHGTVGKCMVSMGHARLSILDLSEAANQPFESECREFVIAFNGEIYNHHLLRSDLRSLGVVFRTRSDTEVLLQAYMKWGAGCLPKLRGIFAFIIVDRVRKRVFAARDGFGVKPLYFAEDKESGGYAFASEVRALEVLLGRRFPIDEEYLGEFLLNGFLYEPSSGLRGVRKVPPGGVVSFDLDTLTIRESGFREEVAGSGDLADLINRQLDLEVEADVPVGIFFSGGVDSSLIAACSSKRPLDALLVAYGEDPSQQADRVYAREIARELGLTYREIEHVTPCRSANDIMDDVRSVASGTEEPVSDFTYSATRRISRAAREAGFRVMLSGMGGDELFAGYPRHVAARRWAVMRHLGFGAPVLAAVLGRMPRWGRRVHRLARFLDAGSFGRAYTSLVGYFSYREVEQMLGGEESLNRYDQRISNLLAAVAGLSHLKQAMHLDRYGFLSHNLTVTDKASMSESLEVRVPLLTESIAAFGMALKDNELIAGNSGKRPLKQILRSHLGDRLVDRPKAPFNPPLDGLMTGLGAGVLEENILSAPFRRHLDPGFVRKLIKDHFSGAADNTYRIWQLLYLSAWFDEHMDKSGRH